MKEAPQADSFTVHTGVFHPNQQILQVCSIPHQLQCVMAWLNIIFAREFINNVIKVSMKNLSDETVNIPITLVLFSTPFYLRSYCLFVY